MTRAGGPRGARAETRVLVVDGLEVALTRKRV